MVENFTNTAPTRPAPLGAGAQRTGSRLGFLAVALALLAVIMGGLLWFFSIGAASPLGAGWYLFSFATGLTMIVLPCTLPLAFVIVPLSLGKGYAKGLAVAVAFGLGVAITLSLYGILAAILGKAIFGFSGASGEVVKNIFYAIAGLFAIAAALGELGFIRFRSPSYLGAAPAFVQRRHDLAKAFALGLFLGNIGVGCPHPATPIILGQIAITGEIFYGWLLFFVHALGRILPLLFLAVLGILGVNATRGLVRHKDAIARATAWGMVFVGGFLFTLGFFGHDWWVNSGQHSYFEFLTQEERVTGIIAARLNVAPPHAHAIETGTGFFGLPLWLGNWALVALWALPLWWSWLNERRQLTAAPEAERAVRSRALRFKGAFFLTLTLLLGLVFIQTLPHWFLAHKSMEDQDGMPTSVMREEQVLLAVSPSPPTAGLPAMLTITLRDEGGEPLTAPLAAGAGALHVIIISTDTGAFAHRHMGDAGVPIIVSPVHGTVVVPHTFPSPGRYFVNVEYAHAAHELARAFPLEVDGTPSGSPPDTDLSRQKSFSGYDVALTVELSTPRAGNEATLTYDIRKEGAPVADLEPYIGKPMHLSLVPADLTDFLHTHAEIHDPLTGLERKLTGPLDRFGSPVEAHVRFPTSGRYHLFGEFKHQGQVVVTKFLIDVAAPTGPTSALPEIHNRGVLHAEDEPSLPRAGEQPKEMMGENTAEMMEGMHEEADTVITENPLLGNRLLYFVVSVVLIVLLTWGVVRYARVR